MSLGCQIGTCQKWSNRIFRLSRDVGKGCPWDVLGTNVCRLGLENESNTENNNRVLNDNYQTLLVKFIALGSFIK